MNCIWLVYFLYILVLAQAHGDPLLRVDGLRKLVCLSEKRFEELRGIYRGMGRVDKMASCASGEVVLGRK